MPRINAFMLAVPAVICAATIPAAQAMSVDSKALVRMLDSRNADKAQKIQRRLDGIDAQRLNDADAAKAKDDYLKREIERAEGEERAAAQFGGAEGQATAREVTTILKALREQERWEAARRGPNANAPNRAEQILRDGAGQTAVDQHAQAKAAIVAEIEEEQRRLDEQAEKDRQAEQQADAEALRRTSMAPPQGSQSWETAMRYAGEFSGFRVDRGPGFMGEERVGTTERRLGIVQPDATSNDAYRQAVSAYWNATGSIEPLWPGTGGVSTQTWIAAGGQYAEYERRSSQALLDVGPNHRVLIPGTGDPSSFNGPGFSIGPGGGFNLVRDLSFREDVESWSLWGKYGQTYDCGTLKLSAYGMAAFSQAETSQYFGGVLPNVPPRLTFEYDTDVKTNVGSFGLGLQAEVPIDQILGGPAGRSNLSVTGGALITADFIQSEGRDQLRVERPTVFVDTQWVSMRQTDVEAGYELNLGLRYKPSETFAIDLSGRYGSHTTGIGIERLGTEASRIDHVRQDSWGIGLGITWTR
jgi:hypothetical protein